MHVAEKARSKRQNPSTHAASRAAELVAGTDLADLVEDELLLRPERLRVVNGSGRGRMNVMRLRIKTVINYGESVLLIGMLGQREARVRIPGRDHPPVTDYGEIEVGWEPSDAHLLRPG